MVGRWGIVCRTTCSGRCRNRRAGLLLSWPHGVPGCSRASDSGRRAPTRSGQRRSDGAAATQKANPCAALTFSFLSIVPNWSNSVSTRAPCGAVAPARGHVVICVVPRLHTQSSKMQRMSANEQVRAKLWRIAARARTRRARPGKVALFPGAGRRPRWSAGCSCSEDRVLLAVHQHRNAASSCGSALETAGPAGETFTLALPPRRQAAVDRDRRGSARSVADAAGRVQRLQDLVAQSQDRRRGRLHEFQTSSMLTKWAASQTCRPSLGLSLQPPGD